MSLVRRVGLTALSLVLYLVGADLVGVAACFVLDVAPIRGKSPALGYTIWAVLGIFVGMIHYGSAAASASGRDVEQAAPSRAEARSAERLVVAVTAALLAGLTALFWRLFWEGSVDADFAVVPDHRPTTLVFFAAIMAATAFSHHLFMPQEAPPHPSRARAASRRTE